MYIVVLCRTLSLSLSRALDTVQGTFRATTYFELTSPNLAVVVVVAVAVAVVAVVIGVSGLSAMLRVSE